jgi:hypothetical protein
MGCCGQKVKGFVVTMSDVLRHAVASGEVIDKQLGVSRLLVCADCKEFERKWGRCKQCGCFMKAKALLVAAKCPIGKWRK